jgi:hypothetical protein
MSEVEVRDAGNYELLLTQKRETLPAAFAAAGWRSIAWMPGMRNPWPEGAYYGFAALYGEKDIDYRGPDFGWWRIPDQFALAKLDAQELAGEERAPRFVFFPTINTHVPFRPTPPYQADWRRVLGDAPFDAAKTQASVAQTPEWTNLTAAYADSLAYTFEYLAGYLRERPDEDLVLVLVGDHQPAASVTGVGARWDVPVHVITSRPRIADKLVSNGFVDGVALEAMAAPLTDMPGLTRILLRAFDSSAGAPHPTERDATRSARAVQTRSARPRGVYGPATSSAAAEESTAYTSPDGAIGGNPVNIARNARASSQSRAPSRWLSPRDQLNR